MQLLGADRGRQLGAQKVIVELDQRVSEGVAQRVNNFGRDIFWNRSATVHLIHPFSPKFNLKVLTICTFLKTTLQYNID